MNSIHERFQTSRNESYRQIVARATDKAYRYPKELLIWETGSFFDRIQIPVARMARNEPDQR